MNPLRLKRLERGLTQYSLYSLTKVPQPYISLAEKGFPILKKDHMEKIAKALGVEVEEIFPKEMGSRKDSNGKTSKS